MKELSEDEIQKLLESDNKTAPNDFLHTNEDARLYIIVFKELKKEPALQLPADFSEKVANRVFKPESKSIFISMPVLLGGSIILVILLSIISMYLINAALLKEWITTLIEFRWIILFGLAMFVLIELGDKLLIRRKISIDTIS